MWVIAIDVIKTTREIEGAKVSVAREEIRIIAIRFMCMPGIRPVIVPARRPIKRAMISSRII